jgi:hypothetical protein
MSFLHPIWLTALLPWAGVTVYLLWGRRKRVNVPFLDLWQIPVQGQRPRRKLAAPPVALAMAILAMLLSVLGAAGPSVVAPGGAAAAGAVTVIVDRGISMSARRGERTRYSEALDEVSRALGARARVDLLVVPGEAASRTTDASDLSGMGQRVTRTAVRTEDALRRLVRRRLEETEGAVIVVSDVDLGPLREDARVVQVAPEGAVTNAGIVALAARQNPKPQVMVRVRNDTPGLTAATLTVSAGENVPPTERRVDLPPAGGQRDYFVDVARLGETVFARLLAPGDELEADDRAWLVRESSPPAIEAKQPVGALERLVAVYRQLRPPDGGSRKVLLVGSAAELGQGTDGVVVHAGGAWAPVRAVSVVPHPITDAVRNWTELSVPAGTAAAPPAGWTPLLSTADGRVLVAVRESNDVRQAWVALDVNRWAHTHEYVAFWTAVFDWTGTAGGAGESFASHPLDERDPAWRPSASDPAVEASTPAKDAALWPGLFTRQDGARRAYHAPPADLSTVTPSPYDWRAKLAAQAARAAPRLDLSPALLLASTAALVVAAATWRRRSRRDIAADSGEGHRPAPPNFADSPRRRRRRNARRPSPGASPISAES